jgi:Fe2+ transport system protein B
VAAIQSADWGATQLSRRIATLTVWLGVFTVLIFVPTVILVLLGMTELGWVP